MSEGRTGGGFTARLARMSDGQIRSLAATFTGITLGLIFLIALFIKFDLATKLDKVYDMLVLEDRSKENLELLESVEIQQFDIEDAGAPEDAPALDPSLMTAEIVMGMEVANQTTAVQQYITEETRLAVTQARETAERQSESVAGDQAYAEVGESGGGATLSGESGGLAGGGALGGVERGSGPGGGGHGGRGTGGMGRGGTGKSGDGLGGLGGMICDRADLGLRLDARLANQLNHRSGYCLMKDRWPDARGSVWTLFFSANPGTKTVSIAALKDFDETGVGPFETRVLVLVMNGALSDMELSAYREGLVGVLPEGWNINVRDTSLNRGREIFDLVRSWWTKSEGQG